MDSEDKNKLNGLQGIFQLIFLGLFILGMFKENLYLIIPSFIMIVLINLNLNLTKK